jgi:hypothetical protein
MAQSIKLNLFYEYQKGIGRNNRRGRVYVCSMCKAELLSKPLLLEHKSSTHAY